MSDETSRKLECEEIFALLSEYLDKELSPDIADCISAHVSGCEPCVDFVESLRKSVMLCKQYQPKAMPSPLAADVRQQLRQAYDRMITRRKGLAAK